MPTRERAAAVCVLSVVGVLGALVFVRAAAGDYSWTTGPGTQYTFWLTEPWLYAGPALVVVTVLCAGLLLRPLRQAVARVAVVTTVIASALTFRLVAHAVHQRGHPEGFELAALRRLVPPAGAVNDRTGLLSEGPPTAVRSWRVPKWADACPETAAVMQAWADPGSVNEKPSYYPDPDVPCEWFARYRGWQVLVEVVVHPKDPRLGEDVMFEVGTPNVQF
jgi:hypothetical protein